MELYINYRNSKEITQFYNQILQNALPQPIHSEIPVFSCGDVIINSAKDTSQIAVVVKSIIQSLKSDYQFGEIGIVCIDGKIVSKYICEGLASLGIPTTVNLESSNKVLVTSPKVIRGHERKALIVIVSSNEYMTRDLGKAINSYIALSRARDRLFVIKIGD